MPRLKKNAQHDEHELGMIRIIVIAIAALTMMGCGSLPTALAQNKPSNRSFSMGISYWPEVGASPQATVERLKPIQRNSDVVQTLIPWCPGGELNSFDWLQTLDHHTEKLGIGLDWQHDSRQGLRCRNKQSWSWADPEAQDQFIQRAVELVRRYEPAYMVLGVEVDYYAAHTPNDFPSFVKVYQEAKDSIQRISPKTKVGVSIQYDHATTTPSLFTSMLDVFEDNSDFIGISTYPHINNATPNDIGNGYFRELQQVDVPITVVEAGWPGDGPQQQRFVSRLLEAAHSTDISRLIWTAATDVPADVLRPGTPEWATEIGLWGVGYVPKPSLDVWRSWLAVSVVN